jgi:hypothetical protein
MIKVEKMKVMKRNLFIDQASFYLKIKIINFFLKLISNWKLVD